MFFWLIAKVTSLVSSLTFVIEFINTKKKKNRILKQQQLGAKKPPSRSSPVRFCIVLCAFFMLLELLSACCSLDRYDSNRSPASRLQHLQQWGKRSELAAGAEGTFEHGAGYAGGLQFEHCHGRRSEAHLCLEWIER